MSEEQQKKTYNLSNSILGAFDQIKTSILGLQDPESNKLDQDIDGVISSLSSNITNKDAYNYAETVKSILTQNIDSSSFDTNVGHSLLSNPENIRRLARYANADDIEMNISQCGRALKVLSDSIISPDNITKEILQFLIEGNKTDSLKEMVNILENISDELSFEDELFPIVYQTLKYGDYFLEIADYKSKEIPITQSLYLTEKAIYPNKKIKKIPPVTGVVKVIKETVDELGLPDTIEKDVKITVEIIEEMGSSDYQDMIRESSSSTVLNEESTDSDSNFKNKNKNKKYLHELENIRLIPHDPRRVVKLQSERYRMNLGYLILPTKFNKGAGTTEIYNSSIASTSLGGGLQPVKGIDHIYADIIKMIKKYINKNDIDVDGEELKELLKRAVKDLEEHSSAKSIKIRYISPERMEHFCLNTSANFPYGEGIFERCMYNAKLYIALKTAITIKRVSDSSEKRIIYVDTTLPRNSRNMIESLKEKLKKTKYSMDTFGNIGSIGTMLTNYQELFVPMNKQREYVRFDTLPPSTDIRSINDELKTFRDDIVSSLDVPPVYIGLEENLSNKSALAHESFMFAETINSYQKIFSKNLFSLFSKISKYTTGQKISKDIKITFPAPKFLRIEREADHADSVARLITAYQGLDIPREYLKNKYISMNWEEIDEFIIEELLNKKSEPQEAPDDSSMMMGAPGGFGGASPSPMTPPTQPGL